MSNGNNAWVTCAFEEGQLLKALLLAGSLRRVGTSAKLVLITGERVLVSSYLTDKLEAWFDLVVTTTPTLGDDDDDKEHDGRRRPKSLDMEQCCYNYHSALLHTFTLVQFEKCVYLSPSMVVVANCDEIFEQGHHPSVFWRSNGDGDPSVMLICPSWEFHELLKNNLMMMGELGGGATWVKSLFELLKANLPMLGSLDGRYNVEVSQLGGGIKQQRGSGNVPFGIVNFNVDGHPWDLWKSGMNLNSGTVDFENLLKKLVELAVGLILPSAPKNGGIGHKGGDWSGGADHHPEPIAIVGMSFKLPGGNSEEEFWKLLIEGRSGIRRVPPHRWTKEHSMIHCTDTKVEAGFLEEPIDEFDTKFFEVNPKDAVVLDPQIRLLYEVSWEALEQGGIDPMSLQGSQTGIFVGSWMYNYRDLLASTTHLEKNMFRAYMGNSIGAESARLSHFFGTTGPAVSTESGCSSSIVAVHLAVESLRHGKCSMALAAGVNLLLHPFTSGMMEGVLAPDYRCKTFDAKADGFARAEGVAALVMKRLSDAVRDGDSILGLVRGSAIVQEGHSKSLGTPTIHCEALAMELALKDAGVDGGDVSYVEAHGTGTAVGDPMEVAAITIAYKSQGRAEPLVIGSVKTNVGHTESVSGITGIIKVLLSMKHETIPPHLHLESLSPDINLEALPAIIPLQPRAWPKSEKKRRIAGVSSFGITGTDGHVIIEEPPALPNNSQVGNNSPTRRPLHLLKLSAKSPESFEALLQSYEQMLESTEESFEDICYSANTGRASFPHHRGVILAKDCLQAAKMLKENIFKRADAQGGGVGAGGAGLCFLFTGQGSQYPGMGKMLYESSPIYKMHFDRGADILKMKYSISMKDAMWGSDPTSSELLNRTLYSQTSIFVLEYSLLKLWESWGVRPDYVMGHSLGEFAAAVASGALTFEDALMLVAERSRLIDSLPRGKMLVVKANKATVEQTIAAYSSSHPRFWVDTAALNSHDQTVVAGESGMIEEFEKCCEEKKLKCVMLASTHAFHSRHMDPMLEEYGRIASTVRRRPPPPSGAILPKYISGMEGKVLDVDNLDANYWVAHTRQKVSFMEACKAAQSEGISLFLEVGPHPVLSALTMTNVDGSSVSCLPSLRRNAEDCWSVLLESLSKLYLSGGWKGSIDWKGFDRGYSRTRAPLPFYPFNKKSIWAEIRPQLPLVHPLLGRILPASTPQFIYETGLSSGTVPYLQDHVIGNTVIFPGAGFLEMCLAAGYASAQGFKSELPKPRRPMALKNLKIGSPLALQESRNSILQTTVNLEEEEDNDDDGGYPVSISRFCSNSSSRVGEWINHATARFYPICSSSSSNLEEKVVPSPSEIQAKWEKSDNRDFYQRLPEVGLRFGPTFQSLECGWRSADDSGILFKVKVPQDYDSYLVHPVVADAMLQALMVASAKKGTTSTTTTTTEPKKKLQVPVCIGEFVWVESWSSSSSVSSELYIYCPTTTPRDGNATLRCHLMTQSGTLLATMGAVEFVETSAKLVEGMGNHHNQSTKMMMGATWEEVYRNCPGPLQNRLDYKDNSWISVLSPQLQQEMERLAEPTEEDGAAHSWCTTSTWNYLLRALYELGWEPQVGQPFTPAELLGSLKIEASFKDYITFFLRSLATNSGQGLEMEEEDEASAGERLSFRWSQEPPSHLDLEHWLSLPKPPSLLARQDVGLTTQVGMNLKGILSGVLHPLSILFPEENAAAKPSAKTFYTERALANDAPMRKLNQAVIDAIVGLVSKETTSTSKQPTIIRILEIGSGTGAFSRAIVELCEVGELPFEFHFTDVSSAFFIAAEKEFGGKYGGGGGGKRRVVFKKYDMEEDPLSQGFSPGYFDLILAAEVLHIAKDVRRTLKRVRSLLKPGGLLEVIETVTPDETLTFIFGLLEGYWSFEDLDFRRWHATLTPPMWETALREADFSDVRHFKCYMGVHGVFVATGGGREQRDDGAVSVLREVEDPKHTWILFDEGTSLTKVLERRLAEVNREVVLFGRPTGLDEKDHHHSNSMSESEFGAVLADLFKRVTSSGLSLEGILYLWGLDEEKVDQGWISLPFVTLCQQVITLKGAVPSLYVVTQGVHSVSGSQVLDPTAATLLGIVKCMNTENMNLNFSAIDLSPDQSLLSQADELFCNVWGRDRSEMFVMREGRRLQPKFASVKQQSQSNNDYYLPLPNGCDRFRLVLPESKLISDLEFTFLDNYVLEEGEIEVEVKAMALNFRDVMVVLKPVPEFDRFNAIGLDVAGVVTKVGPGAEDKWKVGARVIGMQLDENLAMPSHLKMKADHAVALPGNMTFVEGATLPAVFSTAYYCLVKVAQLKAGETLLVHTASGGVGLCAIQFAKRLGVEVIGTAGSPRKRTFLRNLGIQHVFNSRNTEYGQQILEVTGGRGVDVVLNSLTGPGFKEESLRALGENGRFVEMSKMNVWKVEEVEELRPDVSYTIADLTSLEESEYTELYDSLKKQMSSGEQVPIEAIPYERFDALNIRGALNYLQKAKHVGKIVCVMPELSSSSKQKFHERTPLFNPDSTYLVTGGLGGIGFEVVKWILRSGGKHVAIASRCPPKPEMADKIEALNGGGGGGGGHVVPFQVNIGNFDQCQQLFEAIRKDFPPLRGVMHVAGVLADATIENQNWANFRHTYNPKVEGTWNLHELTKSLLLEHFVLFSSMTAVLGSPGQANHAASNSFEDAFAHYRRSMGLPATSINWGNWGEVGVATELDFPGISPISTVQGISVLEHCLRTQWTQTAVVNFDSVPMVIKLFPKLKSYLDDKRLLGEVMTQATLINSDEFWAEVDAAEEREDKVAIFKKHIILVTRRTLNLDHDEVIDDNAEFSSIGVDSLMMLEMKNGLQNVVGSRLTITASQVKDCTTPELLANRLVDLLEGQEEEKNLPTMEELRVLIKEDCVLPDHVTVYPELPPSEPIDQVSTVLLTGVTGALGPYLLRELTQNPQISKVYCLIRKFGKSAPSARLKSALDKAGLLEKVDLDRVECIQGDMSRQSFGMDEEEYHDLAEKVDAVFHCAVLADHTAKYWRSSSESGKCSRVRTANVTGTLRVLEFCVTKRLKHLFHASSLVTINTIDESGAIAAESWQENDAFDNVNYNSAYAISKFVSEQFVKQAVERGLPATALRLPLITGHSLSGRVDYSSSHLHIYLLTILKLRAIAEVPLPVPHIPVDTCARLCAQVGLHPGASGQVYNVHPRFVEVVQVLVAVAQEEFDIGIDVVPNSQFFERLKAEPNLSAFDQFKILYDNENVNEDFDFHRNYFQMYISGGETTVDVGKIGKIVPGFEGMMEPLNAAFRRDLKYLKAQGAFDKFGINSGSSSTTTTTGVGGGGA